MHLNQKEKTCIDVLQVPLREVVVNGIVYSRRPIFKEWLRLQITITTPMQLFLNSLNSLFQKK